MFSIIKALKTFSFFIPIFLHLQKTDKQDIGARCGKTCPEICHIIIHSKNHWAYTLLHAPGFF